MLMEALWAAGAKVQAYDPEAMEEAQRIYGDRDDLTLAGTKEAALQRRRRARHHDRMAGVPRARLRPDRRAARGAGHLRRPQPLRSRADGAAAASPTTPSAAAPASRPAEGGP